MGEQTMNDLAIEYESVEALIPYVANSRTHSDAQVAQIAASIKEFGWTNPILIDGDNTIIAGHGRLLAARKLGMVNVPIIRIDHLTKAQQKALVIADNKLALNADWDIETLRLEIESLVGDGFNFEAIGFTNTEIADILEVEDEVIADEKDQSSHLDSYVIQYNIVFDNEDQQRMWFNFIRKLKVEYEEYDTLAERLTAYLQEHGCAEG